VSSAARTNYGRAERRSLGRANATIAAACLALAGAATANSARAEGWTGNISVSTLSSSDDSDAQGQGVWATFTGLPASGCSNNVYRVWSRSAGGRAENVRQILSILTAAQLSGRFVNLYVGPCSPQGNPYIYGASLR
jgi:hypothetical protein